MYTHNWWHVVVCYLEGHSPINKVLEVYDHYIWKELQRSDADCGQVDKLKKSVEDEIHFLKGRVSELESDLVSKSTEVKFAVSRKEEALSSAFAEIDRLKEENSVKT
ncbi:nuclear-pore anchor-like [Magnolia sinica]|uniref:nuclear-pore anchor-like n=1 Tax=Magnolia sinica TaxID=86752 RepID=UPI00265A355B|nr:nuclear-pore anchor-like [Magnolia sinica]